MSIAIWAVNAVAQDKEMGFEGCELRLAQSGKADAVNVSAPCPGSAVETLAGAPTQDGLSPSFLNSFEISGKFGRLTKIEFSNRNGQEDICSGYLLGSGSNWIVLTAGHCTCGQTQSYRITSRGNERSPSQRFVLASLPTRYGGYSCLLGPEGQPGRDIALLTVELETDYPSRAYLDKISAFPKVNVASMFEVFNDSPTRRLVGAGYGATEQGLPGDARAAVIPIASYFCGGGAYSASTCSSFREFVLADRAAPLGANRSDSCGGDSGAPVFWQAPPASIDGKIGANPNRPIMLVGITSRAVAGVRHNAGTTCGGGGIYTALGHPEVIQWLRANGIPTRNALDYSVQGRPAP